MPCSTRTRLGETKRSKTRSDSECSSEMMAMLPSADTATPTGTVVTKSRGRLADVTFGSMLMEYVASNLLPEVLITKGPAALLI